MCFIGEWDKYCSQTLCRGAGGGGGELEVMLVLRTNICSFGGINIKTNI